MKRIFAFLCLSLATSYAFAIPCTSAAISETLQDYINAQPICFAPCEAAKVYQNIYQHGLELVKESCEDRDPVAVNFVKELNESLSETSAAIRANCH